MNPPGQSIIDVLNTVTLHIYIEKGDDPPGQLIIDALYTITLYIYIYIYIYI